MKSSMTARLTWIATIALSLSVPALGQAQPQDSPQTQEASPAAAQDTQPAQPNDRPFILLEQPAAEPQLPDSPGAVQTQSSTPPAAQPATTPAISETPSGTAAAQTGRIAGSPASRPAGVAIAPAKQRQVHSLLIKMGVIVGAGVALGTVAALSAASSSRPPGAQ